MVTVCPALLLIEPAATDRRTMRDVLAEAPAAFLRVDHVTTVKEGLERLAAQPVSAVLLDLTLTRGAQPDRGR